MNIKCNGYRPGVPEFSAYAQRIMQETLERQRPTFVQENGRRTNDFHFGRRFNDDWAASIRIRSATDEKTFLVNPVQWVWAALEDCASSDHWYEYEKQW